MRQTLWLVLAVLTWLAPLEAWSQLTAPPTRYRVVALGTLGGKSSIGFALNNRGQVVGQSEDSKGRKRAFLWEKGKMRALNLLSVESILFSDINDTGQVVCVATAPGGKPTQVVLWQNGETRTIFTEREPKQGHTRALISNRGMIVVVSESATGSERVFTWQQGKRTDIQIAPSYKKIWPYAINDSGQVVCAAFRVDSQGNGLNQPICILEQGRLRPLGKVDRDHVNVAGINNRCQIVGFGRFPQVSPATLVPFLWDKGKLTILKTSDYSDLWGPCHINNKGQIVGIGVSDSKSLLFLWQAGKLYQLNDLLPLKEGWKVNGDRMSINDRGEILVHLEHKEQTRAYLLVPINEARLRGLGNRRPAFQHRVNGPC